MIDFNIPPFTGNELQYMADAVHNRKICGDGPFTKKCHAFFEKQTGAAAVYLTTSGTSALEMAAILSDIKPGDEVLLPSFTFCSTADAFVARGARLVFVDIRPDTLNIDETKLEDAITERTRAIAVVHYAGVSCAMDEILTVARKHHLIVIEDAAQAVGSSYKGKALGTLGDFGCYSFHETKNYSMGEGGALLLPTLDKRDEAEICREKGTDRSRFFRGQVDKYTWVDYGSSYLPSDINAAYLWAQLEMFEEVRADRMASWNAYDEAFRPLAREGLLELPVIPPECLHNAHMYYLKLRDLKERSAFISFLKEHGVMAVFHYIPLHSSPAGLKFGSFSGEDVYTTKESERLVRLPLYYRLPEEDREHVINTVKSFFRLI
ncbi:MAG: dTDP-4-amino-4,6-dideoxygalactose transaminase [Lachnospiraceae bacterium]|nr:dTDP-4-amino-4,6-dideoxygalactose transaminase [Lachnospiraceae bacterium]